MTHAHSLPTHPNGLIPTEARSETEWIITETGQLDEAAVDRLGNKLLIGNGFIGYRGTLEEYDKELKTATIVSGVYDKVGDAWREPINLPNGCFTRFFFQGEPLHALTSKVVSHSQSLDIRRAIHQRETIFETTNGTRITICSQRFASLTRYPLICLEFTFTADQDCTLILQTGIDGDVWDLNGPHLEKLALQEQGGVLSVSAITHENGIPVAVAEWTGTIPYTVSINDPLKTVFEGKTILREIQVPLKAGQASVLYKVVAHVTGLESAHPLEESLEICREAAQTGFDTLRAEHCSRWQARWADCDIQIEGDPEAQQALRFSMYHLLAIAPTHAENVSIPARGLSGQVYKGGIFWDTEIFMMPFFMHAFPAIARNLLLYRFHTLEGARRKAHEYGYRGAFYAWESQDSGDDACTLFSVTDVFTHRPMRTYFRDKQVHISADVVYAYWQYYNLTGDDTIWRDGGAEVVLECARFYLSYAYYNPDKRRYEILDVTGPDEYHERVHNNAFTNWMVAHTFEVCLSVADYLRKKFPQEYQSLFGPEEARRDLDLIKEMAESLYRPGAEADGAVIPQFDGYYSLEDIPLKNLLTRKLEPDEYLGGGNGLATTTQIIKQADVILALVLFGDKFTPETKSANWKYYEPRSEHGSSLSACSYSLIAAQTGRVDWAYRFFMKTATIDLTGEGKQYVGPLYIGGTHPAANGGAWMAAALGLCGIRCAENTIHIEPHLPAHWKSVTVPVAFKGQRLHITLTRESIKVKTGNPLIAPISVEVAGIIYPLAQAGELVFPVNSTF